jgi:hypothetical protein
MDTRPETPETPNSNPTGDGEAGDEPTVGFWKRMFGGAGKEEGEASEAGKAPEAPSPAKPVKAGRAARNRPRKRSKTIFDQAEEQQRRKFAKAAIARRERLAQSIGERVERALDERFASGEERLADVAGVFEDMNGLLGAIGRNLDDQGTRAERMAANLELLPQAAENERLVLEGIAAQLEGQAASVEGVPEVVSLVRHGSQVAEQRLTVLRGLQTELETQREQGQQMLEVLRRSSAVFEDRMSSLEETILKGQVEARRDARELRDAVTRSAEALAEESMRETQRSAHLLDGLRDMTARLSEGNAVAVAAARSQDKAVESYRDAHEEMVDMLVRSQNRTLAEMHRLEEDSQQRAEELARRSRVTLVGAAGFLAILAVAFLGASGPSQPQIAPVYVPVSTPSHAAAPKPKQSAPKALPAGMPKSD